MSQVQIFRAAFVHAGDGRSPLADHEVVVEGGRITALREASKRTPKDAVIHDFPNGHLCPGFVDAHVHLGVMPEGFANESKDINEQSNPVTPQMQAIDAVWPGDTAFNKARAAGVTTVCVLPGSANVVSGTGVVLKTVGRNVERMSLAAPACLKVAFGLNVKTTHGVKAGRMPLTRMGIAALFREAFEEARRYGEKRYSDPTLAADPGKEVLLSALRGELPVRAHCARSDDILTALRLAREFNLRLVLDHGYEAHMVLDEVKEAGVPIVLGPAFRTCGSSESLHFGFESTKVLDDAGLLVAHMTDHPIVPIEYLSLQAGLCVRAGMTPERALLTITANPAKILGLADRVGRIAIGLDADLVIKDGPPLSVESRVLATFIDGHRVFKQGDPLPVPGAGLL